MTKRILVASDRSEASSEALRQAQAEAESTGALLEELFIEGGDEAAAIVRRARDWSADLVVVPGGDRSGSTPSSVESIAERVVQTARCPVLVARRSARRGTVLVATDFSDPTMPAIAAAADEARRRKARLVLLHAVAFGSVAVTIEEIARDIMHRDGESWNIDAEICRSLDARLRRALAQLGADGETQVVGGAPAQAIVRAAEEHGAELIVVGTRGRTGLVRLALGSNADAVVHDATCSVLAVRLGGHVASAGAVAANAPH
jgi:nucleotide-binding universal stress UspA family protein